MRNHPPARSILKLMLSRVAEPARLLAFSLLLALAASAQTSRDGQACRVALGSIQGGFTGCRVLYRQVAENAPDAVLMVLAREGVRLFNTRQGVGVPQNAAYLLAFQKRDDSKVLSAVRISAPALAFPAVQVAWDAPGEVILALEGDLSDRIGYWRLGWDATTRVVRDPVSWPSYRVDRAVRDADRHFYLAINGKRRAVVTMPPPGATEYTPLLATGAQAERVLAEVRTIASSENEILHPPSTPLPVRTDQGAVCSVALRQPFSPAESRFQRIASGATRIVRPNPGTPETYHQFRSDPRAELYSPRSQDQLGVEISAAQNDGAVIWYARSFYEGEGQTGIGGFGFLDCEKGALEEYRPPEVTSFSTSAMFVSPGSVWLSLYVYSEKAEYPAGLYHWNRTTMENSWFPVPYIARVIRAEDSRVVLGHGSGITLWQAGERTSYFVAERQEGDLEILPDRSKPRDLFQEFVRQLRTPPGSGR